MAIGRSAFRNANVSLTIKALFKYVADYLDTLSAVGIDGAVTATSITGTDSSLGINGQAAAQGGAVVVTGGTSSTAGNAGGAVSLVGGTPGATSAGGAATVVAGAGGATSGAGGVGSVTGGAGTAGNSAGGVGKVVGGAGQGSAAGGKGQVTGGAGGATGAGGTADVTGGAGGATSGAGGAVNITGGAGTAGNAQGGAVNIAPGAPHGSGLKSHVNVGIAGTVVFYPQAAPKADAGDAAQTITVAEMLAGIVSATPAQARAVTTPTGTEMDAGFNTADIPANFGFDFSVQNRAAFAATDDILTLTAGASGMTITGSAVVSPGSTARFRAVRTGAATWICYKIAG